MKRTTTLIIFLSVTLTFISTKLYAKSEADKMCLEPEKVQACSGGEKKVWMACDLSGKCSGGDWGARKTKDKMEAVRNRKIELFSETKSNICSQALGEEKCKRLAQWWKSTRVVCLACEKGNSTASIVPSLEDSNSAYIDDVNRLIRACRNKPVQCYEAIKTPISMDLDFIKKQRTLVDMDSESSRELLEDIFILPKDIENKKVYLYKSEHFTELAPYPITARLGQDGGVAHLLGKPKEGGSIWLWHADPRFTPSMTSDWKKFSSLLIVDGQWELEIYSAWEERLKRYIYFHQLLNRNAHP